MSTKTDNPQNWQWLDAILNKFDPFDNSHYDFVRRKPIAMADIQARFTAQEAAIQQRLITSIDTDIAAQAKQHQTELLRARIDELQRHGVDDEFNHERIAQLQAELVKLEGGA